MKTETVKITPTKAREWLTHVPLRQRRRDEAQVKKLVTAIEQGEWRQNGATFVFNAQGEMIDGQHRAAAIAKAGRAVWGIVVTNVDSSDETFHTIDDSKARILSDFLQCKHRNSIAAITRFYWLVLNGEPVEGSGPKMPIADGMKVIEEFIPALEEVVTQVTAAARITGYPTFLAFVMFYYGYILKHDVEKLNHFVARLADGVGLMPGCPILELRNKCINQSPNAPIQRRSMFALILKSLNNYLLGTPPKKLVYDPSKEPFPAFLKAK